MDCSNNILQNEKVFVFVFGDDWKYISILSY